MKIKKIKKQIKNRGYYVYQNQIFILKRSKRKYKGSLFKWCGNPREVQIIPPNRFTMINKYLKAHKGKRGFRK